MLNQTDPDVYRAIQQEIQRQKEQLQLIPSENYASLAVLEACCSVLNNKYSEGYPGKRYYQGNEFVDQIENLAIDRAKKLFGAEHANVQSYSGSPANLAIYKALLNISDDAMGLALDQGGHLTHGHKVNASGATYHFHSYKLDPKTEMLDMHEIEKIA